MKSAQGNKKNFKKKKGNNPFWNTISEIRNMTNDHMNSKEKSLFNVSDRNFKAKGPKMPVNHLTGIRKKLISKYKEHKERQKTENLQYDSTQKFNDFKLIEKKLSEKKNRQKGFLKNKYKFSGMKSRAAGTFKNGFLNFTSKEIKNIQGK